MLTQKRLRWIYIFSFLSLGLAAIRLIPPGTTFYAAYHMTIWYGLFYIIVLFQLLFITEIKKLYILSRILVGLFFLGIIFFLLFTSSFLTEHIDRQNNFTTNYARFYTYGQVVKDLALPGNSIFVDSWDSLIYWQAGLPVAYPYIFYYVPMSPFEVYTQARQTMFTKNPPTFYYAYDGETKYFSPGIPKSVQKDYIQLYNQNSNSGLYVYKKVVPNITVNQWKKVEELGFYKSKQI